MGRSWTFYEFIDY